MSVERDTLLSSSGLSDSQADTEDGIGTKVRLVGAAIELVEEFVNLGLVLDVEVFLDNGGADNLIDVLNGLEDTCKTISLEDPQNLTSISPGTLISHPFLAIWTCLRPEAQ